jgi:hypothetical protein
MVGRNKDLLFIIIIIIITRRACRPRARARPQWWDRSTGRRESPPSLPPPAVHAWDTQFIFATWKIIQSARIQVLRSNIEESNPSNTIFFATWKIIGTEFRSRQSFGSGLAFDPDTGFLVNTQPGFLVTTDPETDFEDLTVEKISRWKEFQGCGSGSALILDPNPH